MNTNDNETMNVNDDHDDLVVVQEQQAELDAWLTACGLNPSLHRPMLQAAGLSKLIHLKVVSIATIQDNLKGHHGTMDTGDIALIMAGVDWYREWRDAPSPKPPWNLVCHADNFEAFVERWNPDEQPRLRDTKAPVVAAMVAAVAEPRNHFTARRLDPPTVASSPLTNSQDDALPLLCIPTGELIDAKNTIQSHSILARAAVTATSSHNGDVPLAVETVPMAPNATERTKVSTKAVKATATVVPKSSQRHEALQAAATKETQAISAGTPDNADDDDLEWQQPESNETLARVPDVEETESVAANQKDSPDNPDTPPTNGRRGVCMIVVGVIVLLGVGVGVANAGSNGTSTTSADATTQTTTVMSNAPTVSPQSPNATTPSVIATVVPSTGPPVPSNLFPRIAPPSSSPRPTMIPSTVSPTMKPKEGQSDRTEQPSGNVPPMVSPTMQPKEGQSDGTGQPGKDNPDDQIALGSKNQTIVPGSNGGVSNESGGSTTVADEDSDAAAPPTMTPDAPLPTATGNPTIPPLSSTTPVMSSSTLAPVNVASTLTSTVTPATTPPPTLALLMLSPTTATESTPPPVAPPTLLPARRRRLSYPV